MTDSNIIWGMNIGGSLVILAFGGLVLWFIYYQVRKLYRRIKKTDKAELK